MSESTIRIGGASAFLGDSSIAVPQLICGGTQRPAALARMQAMMRGRFFRRQTVETERIN